MALTADRAKGVPPSPVLPNEMRSSDFAPDPVWSADEMRPQAHATLLVSQILITTLVGVLQNRDGRTSQTETLRFDPICCSTPTLVSIAKTPMRHRPMTRERRTDYMSSSRRRQLEVPAPDRVNRYPFMSEWCAKKVVKPVWTSRKQFTKRFNNANKYSCGNDLKRPLEQVIGVRIPTRLRLLHNRLGSSGMGANPTTAPRFARLTRDQSARSASIG